MDEKPADLVTLTRAQLRAKCSMHFFWGVITGGSIGVFTILAITVLIHYLPR